MIFSGRSLASGLNEDFDSASVDRQSIDIHPPPVILSVAADSNPALSTSADVHSSYADHNSREVTDPAVGHIADFYIPPPSLLSASGYQGSYSSLPEVVADGHERVGVGSQVRCGLY